MVDAMVEERPLRQWETLGLKSGKPQRTYSEHESSTLSCHTIILSYYDTIIYYHTAILPYISYCHTVILPYIILSFCHTIILSYYHIIYCHIIILSFCHTFIQSYYHTIMPRHPSHPGLVWWYDAVTVTFGPQGFSLKPTKGPGVQTHTYIHRDIHTSRQRVKGKLTSSLYARPSWA